MRKEEFLNEMPIRVHNINVTPPDDQISSFNNDDRALLNSEKALEKIKRIWNSSVAEVDLYTLDVKIDPEDALDIALSMHLKCLSDEENERIGQLGGAKGIKFDPNAISIILSNNEGADRLPLTGWIIAHRLYHCFQSDRVSKFHTANTIKGGPNLVMMLSKISEQYKGVMFDLENYCIEGEGRPYLNMWARGCLIGSSKACRDFKLNSGPELLPECFAQYMLRGRVTLRTLPAETFVVDVPGAGPLSFTPSRAQYKYCLSVVDHFERFLNEKFAELIAAARGRVVSL